MNLRLRYIARRLSLVVCSLSLVTSFTSCEDFLEVESLDKIALSNFWNEESDVENMVMGCYSAMQQQAWMDRAILWGEARSENLTGGERITDDTNMENVMMENLNSNNEYAKWINFYEVINRCNLVLHYAPRVAEKDPNYTQSELTATIAEVSALRALNYFYLVRAFRDVPFTMEAYIDDTQKMDLPATPMMEILDSLTADLEKVINGAVKFYPETTPALQTSRITQDAIHALLADMYLWKQDYAKVVEHTDAVIQNKLQEYQKELDRLGSTSVGVLDKLVNGYPLLSDAYTGRNYYGMAFYNIFGVGNSTESILELNFADDDTQLANLAVSNRFGSADKGNGYLRPSDLVANDVSDGLFAVYLNRYDTRNFENIYRLSATNFQVAKYASQDAMVNVKENPYITSNQSLRWPQERCHANWILYRLTDVMLMKAEALTLMVTESEGGYSTEDNTRLRQAYMLVDAVNRRSYGESETESALVYTRYRTKSTMLNLVYDERNRELMFEGKRWFDLVRRAVREGNTNYLKTQAARKYTNNKSAAESKLSRLDAIFWPYNEEELKVNGNLKQNPAFGSGENSSIVVN